MVLTWINFNLTTFQHKVAILERVNRKTFNPEMINSNIKIVLYLLIGMMKCKIKRTLIITWISKLIGVEASRVNLFMKIINLATNKLMMIVSPISIGLVNSALALTS